MTLMTVSMNETIPLTETVQALKNRAVTKLKENGLKVKEVVHSYSVIVVDDKGVEHLSVTTNFEVE